MHLPNLAPENSGLYVCRATYLDIGTQTSEAALLTVLGFFDELHDISITQGTDSTDIDLITPGADIDFSYCVYTVANYNNSTNYTNSTNSTNYTNWSCDNL